MMRKYVVFSHKPQKLLLFKYIEKHLVPVPRLIVDIFTAHIVLSSDNTRGVISGLGEAFQSWHLWIQCLSWCS